LSGYISQFSFAGLTRLLLCGALGDVLEPFQRQGLCELRLVGSKIAGIVALLTGREEEAAIERHPGLDASGFPCIPPNAIRYVWEPGIPDAASQRGQPGALQFIGGLLLLVNAVNKNNLGHASPLSECYSISAHAPESSEPTIASAASSSATIAAGIPAALPE